MATVTVLGIAQDGGRPQPGCQRPCCQGLTEADYRSPVSLGITTANGTTILIEATRDLGRQLKTFGEPNIDHLFLTHAHLGHVDGLGLFGRETMSARGIPLHSSPSTMWKILMDYSSSFGADCRNSTRTLPKRRADPPTAIQPVQSVRPRPRANIVAQTGSRP